MSAADDQGIQIKQSCSVQKRFTITDVLLVLFYIECAVGCSGRWLAFGRISIRMVLFGLCFLVTLPAVFRNRKEVFSNKLVIFAILLALWMMICTAIGIRRGNHLSYIVSDWTSMMSLLLLPGILAVVRSRRQVGMLIEALYWGSAIVGYSTVALHFLLAWMPQHLIDQMEMWFLDHSMGGFTILSTGIYRIYFRSQIFLPVGLVLGLWLLWQRKGGMRIFMTLTEGVIAAACILSFTRGFWLGTAVSFLLVIVLEPRFWKRALKMIAVIAVGVVLIFSASWAVYRAPAALVETINRLSPKLIVMSSESAQSIVKEDKENGEEKAHYKDPEKQAMLENQKALVLRSKTILGLKKNIKLHPIVGSGMGANLDGVRKDGRTEYMYEDLVFKTGLIGLALFLLVFFQPVVVDLRRDWKTRRVRPHEWESDCVRNRFLIASYLGMAVTSALNPFLNTPMGISMLLLLAAAVNSREDNIEDN